MITHDSALHMMRLAYTDMQTATNNRAHNTAWGQLLAYQTAFVVTDVLTREETEPFINAAIELNAPNVMGNT